MTVLRLLLLAIPVLALSRCYLLRRGRKRLKQTHPNLNWKSLR
jgi:hypothetical protein